MTDPCIQTTCQACLVTWERKLTRLPDITYAEVVEKRRYYGACSATQQCGDVHELVGHGSCRCGARMPGGISTDSPDKIISAVCAEHGVTRSDLTGPSREQKQSEARHDVCFMLRQHTRLKLVSVAALIGRKDHTTVIYGVRASQKLRWKFAACRDRMDRILHRLA
jgi:hypothetical protein